MVDSTSALATLGAQPITPESPCGASATDEPSYENLKAEMAKLQSPTAEPVDWTLVVGLACGILKDTSKDLLVASYLCRGLFELQGYSGLETGLTIYRDLIETYWDALFPQRERRRRAAIDWMAEKLGSVLSRRKPAPDDSGAVQHCYGLASQIAGALDEHLGPNSHDMSLLYVPLRELQESLDIPGESQPATAAPFGQAPESSAAAAQPAEEQRETPGPEALAAETTPVPSPGTASGTETAPAAAAERPAVTPLERATATPPEAPPESREAPQTSAPAAAGGSVEVPSSFETETQAFRALRDCQGILRNVVAFFLRKDLTNPLPYRLNRISTWMLVTQAPPSQEQRTQVQPLQPAVIQGYEEMLQQQNYVRLLSEIETFFPKAAYWLDAHRFTAQALEALGSSYAGARQAVIDELASFLRRVPEVLDLTFADGTPFASDEMRAWMEREVLGQTRSRRRARVAPIPAPSPSEVVVSQTDGDGPAPWTQVAVEAHRLRAEGKVIEGAALFQHGQKRAASQRERFMWQLQQARYCLQVGLIDVAVPQLEYLQEQVDRFTLEVWEPELSQEVLRLLLLGYHTLQAEAEQVPAGLDDKTVRVHARLCRLDVTAALALEGHL
jgi:type VI secretion system protein VasJ